MQLKTLKKVMSFLMIMDLALMKIIKIIPVDVDTKKLLWLHNKRRIKMENKKKEKQK